MDCVKNIIGENIKRLREERKYTQAELAKIIATDEKYISAIESGRRIPGRKMVAKLCDAFCVDEPTIRFGEKVNPDEFLAVLLRETQRQYDVLAAGGTFVDKSKAMTAILEKLAELGQG